MTDSKLIETIKVLTPEEREEFALFIASPYFNRGAYSAELLKLYNFIIAASPDFSPEDLRKEDIHHQIFPKKPFSEGRIDRMMFEINKLSKEFLLNRFYNRTENEIRTTVDWMTVLRSKKLDNRVEKELEKIKSFKTSSKHTSIEQFYTEFLIAREEHIWKSSHNKVKDNVGLPELIESLDSYYFSYRLELLNRFLLQQKVSALETPEFIKGALEQINIPLEYKDKNALLMITWKVHKLLRQEEYTIDEFQDLLKALKQHEAVIDPEILAQFYVYLRNLCTFIIDAGNTDFDSLLHSIHRDNLDRGYFYHNGQITPYAYLNIVQFALRAGNVAWANQFVEAHKNRIIGENETHDFYRMNLALCLFAAKKYQEALEIIPFGSSYSFYHLMARRLELKIYYETHSDVLPSKIDAFKMFISRVGRKNLSTNLSELLTNFGNFVSQLSQSIPGDKKRSEQLEKRIREKKLVGERSWLLEKAIELRNGKKR